MFLEPPPELSDKVQALKEAFETGRTVTLEIEDSAEPLTGCVSRVHEGSAGGSYVFSALVGVERVIIGNANSWMSRSVSDRTG